MDPKYWMDKFVAFYYFIILLLVVYMPIFFTTLACFYSHSSWKKSCIITITPAFLTVQYMSICFQNQRLFFSFFLNYYYLNGLSSLVWIRVFIFNSLEIFKAIYPWYLFIIPSESHFLPSGTFQRPKMFTSDMFSDSEIKVMPGSVI